MWVRCMTRAVYREGVKRLKCQRLVHVTRIKDEGSKKKCWNVTERI